MKDLIMFKVKEDNRAFTKREYTFVGPKAINVEHRKSFRNNNMNNNKKKGPPWDQNLVL